MSVAIVVAACVVFVGCLGGEDQAAQPSAEARTALPECPGGDDDLRIASFDVGENPQGVPTAGGALERFLLERNSDLSADAFERTDRASAAVRKASFSYSRDGLKLANIYAGRVERGWLVISYSFCGGIL